MLLHLLRQVFSRKCVFHNGLTTLLGAGFVGILMGVAYQFPVIAITVTVCAILFSIPKGKVAS